MNAGLHATNIIDFASYRARRERMAAANRAGSASPAAVMFGVLPVMFPVVAWIPVWQLSSFAQRADAINE